MRPLGFYIKMRFNLKMCRSLRGVLWQFIQHFCIINFLNHEKLMGIIVFMLQVLARGAGGVTIAVSFSTFDYSYAFI